MTSKVRLASKIWQENMDLALLNNKDFDDVLDNFKLAVTNRTKTEKLDILNGIVDKMNLEKNIFRCVSLAIFLKKCGETNLISKSTVDFLIEKCKFYFYEFY